MPKRRWPGMAGLAAACMLSACGPAAEPGPRAALPDVNTPRAVLAPPPRPPALAPLPDRALRMRPGSSPRRVASVRMTERGRRLLRAGHARRALGVLETSLSTDGSNPYAHYYLALAHYRLGAFEASLDFLEAAEPVLGQDRPWLAQALVLRGDNLRALGRFGAAGVAYRRVLALEPSNPWAGRGLRWTRQRSRAKSW